MPGSIKRAAGAAFLGLSVLATPLATTAQEPSGAQEQAGNQLPENLRGPQRVITVKCKELEGKRAQYGSMKGFFDGKEMIKQGGIDWEDTDYEGAWPTIVMTDFAQGKVLVNVGMDGGTFEKRGVTQAELVNMLRSKKPRGFVVNADMKPERMFVQFLLPMDPPNRGVELFSIDSKTKLLMHTRAAHYTDMSDNASVSTWVFTSKCEWYEDMIALG